MDAILTKLLLRSACKCNSCMDSGDYLCIQDETEYETDSDDEVYGQQLLKPMFVSKSEREV